MNWHSKRDLYERARQSDLVDAEVPEGNPKEGCDGCPRVQHADMLMRYQGRYLCDGCWTELRRRGELGNPR